MKAILSAFSLLLLFLFISCNTDDLRDLGSVSVNHEGDYAISIGSIVFTMADLMENDTNLTSDGNNGLKLVHRENGFFQLTAAELLDELTGDINETYTETEQVGEIEIDDIVEDSFVEFADVISHFNDPTLIDFFQTANGTSAPVPAFNESPNFDQDVPVFPNYTSLNVASGFLKLSLTNSLNFDLEDLEIDLLDVGNNQVLGTLTYGNLPSGGTEAGEIDMSGKTISNQFRIVWKSINSPGTGGNPVMIDLSQQLMGFLKIESMVITAGTVKIPEGILAEGSSTIDFNLDNEEQIRRLQLNDVEVAYEINSEIATDILVRLEFPFVAKGGSTLVHEFTVSPSNPTGLLDFTDTNWFLDQDAAQPFNRMAVNYQAGIPMGGSGLVSFAVGDEIEIKLTVRNMDVEEVIGYFGNYMENFDNTSREFGFDFGFLSDESSPLFFENPIVRIEIDNSFGIPMSTSFDATATGLNGDQLALSPPSIAINHPDITEIGQSAHTLAVINKLNSELVNFLSIYPQQIMYEGAANVNPAADPSVNNFIRSDSRLDASLEFCLPFNFKAESLVYRDTGVAPDLGLDSGAFTIDDIENAIMKVSYENGIPMVSNINLIALDTAGNETIVIENIMFSAANPGDNGIVETSEVAIGSELVELDRADFQALNNASFYIYEVILQTEGRRPRGRIAVP